MRNRSNMVWVVSAQVMRLALTVSVGAWVARRLGAGNFGIYATALGWAGLFGFVAELGIKHVLTAEFARRELLRGRLAGVAFWLWMGLGWITFFASGIILYLFYPDGAMVGIVLIVMSPMLINGLLLAQALWIGLGKSGKVSRLALVGMLSGNAGRVVVLLCGGGLWWIAIVTALEAWLTLWLTWAGCRRDVPSLTVVEWDRGVAVSILHRALPSFLAHTGNLLLLRMDQIMVQRLRGDEAAGQYGVAVRLAEAVYAVGGVVAVLMLPVIAKRAKQRDDSFYRLAEALMGVVAWVGIGSVVCWFFFGEFVIAGLFGSDYDSAYRILIVLAIATVPYLQGELRTNLMVSKGWQKYGVVCSVVGVLLNYGLNLLWIPRYGGTGAAWATVVSYTSAWMLMTLIFMPLRRVGVVQFTCLLRPFHAVRWLREIRLSLRETQAM